MDIAGKERNTKPASLYLASEFDLDQADGGGHLSELMAWDRSLRNASGASRKTCLILGARCRPRRPDVLWRPSGIVKGVDAKTGAILWKFGVGTGIVQSPITYMIDGKQYLAVVAGRIKGPPSFLGKIGQRVIDASAEGGLVIAFELGQ